MTQTCVLKCCFVSLLNVRFCDCKVPQKITFHSKGIIFYFQCTCRTPIWSALLQFMWNLSLLVCPKTTSTTAWIKTFTITICLPCLGPRFNPSSNCYQETLSSQYGTEWKFALEDEMRSLRAKQTWRLVSFPPGHKPIRCIQERKITWWLSWQVQGSSCCKGCS